MHIFIPTQGQVVNEPESAVQGKILGSAEESIKCSSFQFKAAVPFTCCL